MTPNSTVATIEPPKKLSIPDLKRVNLPLALGLAKAGLFVFPADENKRPCIQWREGSTRDPDAIHRLWQAFPTAAPAIDCGRSGVIVIDADAHKDGPEKLGAWLAARGIDTSTLPRTNTQSGGEHFFAPNSAVLGCAKGDFAALGCDIKGDGGYVLAPGALMPNGRRYQASHDHPALTSWFAAVDPDLDETPTWIVETIGAANYQRKENPSLEAALIDELKTEDWPGADELFGPNLGFDLDRLKQKDKRLRDLLDTGAAIDQRTGEPMTHSEALWHLALSCRSEFGDSFSALHLAGLIEYLNETDGLPTEGAFGTFVQDSKPKVGEFDYRQIVRAHLRAPGRFITDGAALGAVEGEADEEDESQPSDKPKAKKRKLQFELFGDVAQSALDDADSPLIAGMLDEGAMSVMYGESNAGKSFIALDMAFHVACGRAWNDRKTTQGLVVYVAAEGGKRFARRVAALRKHYGGEAEGAAFAVVRSAVDLRSPKGDALAIVDLVREAERQTEKKAALIVIDTLSRAMAGGDENSSIDMGALVKNCDDIRAATGAHLLLVHHSGKDKAKGARGHSLLRAATDTELEVVNSRIVTRKQRDMDFAPEIGFVLKSVELGVDASGNAQHSAIVALGAAAPQGERVSAAQALKGNQLELFNVIAALAAERAAKTGAPAHAI